MSVLGPAITNIVLLSYVAFAVGYHYGVMCGLAASAALWLLMPPRIIN